MATVDQLIENLNQSPSEYEERYARWVSIGYDKEKLLELLYELKYLRDHNENESRQKFLTTILEDNDPEHLLLLLQNDEHTIRMALIEKWARIAAMEMLIDGKYTIDTLNTVTQFPLADYQLIVKRTQELVFAISDVTTQASQLASGLAGV